MSIKQGFIVERLSSIAAHALRKDGRWGTVNPHKVLHVDHNDYYGGAEAAFSLQEVETWVEQVNAGKLPPPSIGRQLLKIEAASRSTQFSRASIQRLSSDGESPDTRLGFSRAYSISLAPQLIYTRSNLIPALVSSKVYRQLEFLAVGSWWIYNQEGNAQEEADHAETSAAQRKQRATLRKIPGGREDVFQDRSIDLRSTRSLMKFLKLAADAEAYPTVLPEWGEKPFTEYLESHFKISPKLQAPLLALPLSPGPPSKTTVAYALPRIHRHLTSIGIFGPGFGVVLPKWGGLSEIAQVACRASAVGGGVYALKKGIESINPPSHISTTSEDSNSLLSTVNLQGGDVVKARWMVGTAATLPTDDNPLPQMNMVEVYHLTAIVSSPLSALFPPPAEGSPPPAGVVVVLPSGSLELPPSPESPFIPEVPAINLMIHSSDTGECPEGQCIIYTSTTLCHPSTDLLLRSAVELLLSSIEEDSKPDILWSVSYTQHHPSTATAPPQDVNDSAAPVNHNEHRNGGVFHLQELSPSLALEDEVLRDVKAAWERITAGDGDGRGGFMQFGEREGGGADDEGVWS
ncbi:MAG: hypothetical protein L6R39_004754 [Caloplaca ligustica]|nr:MAG: hypothetical protein L6R39_004754 [Caloplaca ligustica]